MRSGLVHGHELKRSTEASSKHSVKEEEDERTFGSTSQRGVVHRIGGKIVSREEWDEAQKFVDPRDRRKRQLELDAEFEKGQRHEWKRGLAQHTDRNVKIEEALEASSGRQNDYDKELRQKQRWDDPLSRIPTHFPSHSSHGVSSKPRSVYEAPGNRFGLAAGYRWDRVVRGTGFEERWFARLNESKSVNSKHG